MKTWINLSEYVDKFPDSGSVRLHHCKEGRQNDRFYLTRADDGKILGFCHHCGGKGVHVPTAEERRNIRPSTERQSDPFKSWDVPPLEQWHTSDSWHTPEWGKIPLDIRRFWFVNGLNISEYNDLGVKLLNGKTMAIPLRKSNSEVTGIALRPLKEGLPKWIILGEKQQVPFSQIDKTKVLVLTEDYCSALRCSRFGAALPLMGTSLSTASYKQVVGWWKEGRRVYVWLDNDSDVVVSKAKRIYEKLALTVECAIILVKVEPKHFRNNSEILEVISGA